MLVPFGQLPTVSTSPNPIPQAEIDADNSAWAMIDAARNRARAASFCAASPQSFAMFGPEIVAEVQNALNLLTTVGQGGAVDIAAATTEGGVQTPAGRYGTPPRVFPMAPIYGIVGPNCRPSESSASPAPPWGDARSVKPGGGSGLLCLLMLAGIVGAGLYVVSELPK